MIMNNLEQNSFVSYAGAVSLGQMDGDHTRIATQRVEMYPITFLNMPLLQEGDFVIRNNWNYAETSKYYIIYWPQAYNILEATLR